LELFLDLTGMLTDRFLSFLVILASRARQKDWDVGVLYFRLGLGFGLRAIGAVSKATLVGNLSNGLGNGNTLGSHLIPGGGKEEDSQANLSGDLRVIGTAPLSTTNPHSHISDELNSVDVSSGVELRATIHKVGVEKSILCLFDDEVLKGEGFVEGSFAKDNTEQIEANIVIIHKSELKVRKRSCEVDLIHVEGGVDG
jgi:hypothetical protein